MIDLTTAFNAMNPRESWLEADVACPYCGMAIQIAVPREVRASEWACPHCRHGFWFSVVDGKSEAKKQ